MGLRDIKKLVLSLSGIMLFSAISLSSIRFTEVSKQYQVRGSSHFGGHGACWVDVNRDGKLDLYVKNVDSPSVRAVKNALFINYGSFFIDEAELRGVSDAYPIGTHGAVFADLDNDGHFDLFTTTTYNGFSPAYNHIYINNGKGFFIDATSLIFPPQDTDLAPRGVAAVDFDHDGNVDLYFSNPLPDPLYFTPHPSPARKLKNFYLNLGNKGFSAEYRGIDWTGFVQGVSAVDIDGDGDVDLAEAKWGPPSTIYLNEGAGNFIDSGKELGLPQDHGIADNGIIFGDVDNDRDMDMAIVGMNRVVLYRKEIKKFAPYQVIFTGRLVYHACFGDFDHDGDLDLYVSGDNIYENNGFGFFSLIPSSVSGLTASLTAIDPRGAALGDFDDDGDLDIYVTNKRGFNLLFRNEVNDSKWIQVEVLTDHNGGIGGLNTKLDLFLAGHLDELPFLVGHREIQGEYGYLGQDMPTAHFGLPASNRYDLKITFLNGKTYVCRGLEPGQKIQVSYIFPPLNFAGVVKENKALFYRERLIELSWEPNPKNRNIKKYRIYRSQGKEKLFLGEVSAVLSSFTLRHVEKADSYSFLLTAVDQNDNEGDETSVTIKAHGTSQLGGESASPSPFQRSLLSLPPLLGLRPPTEGSHPLGSPTLGSQQQAVGHIRRSSKSPRGKG